MGGVSGLSSTFEFKKDQKDIIDEYLNGCGRVAVSAGAGTGKTTVLVELVTNSVINLLNEDPDSNPFEKILAVTFTVEAARQMKSKIKKRLEEHFSDTSNASKLKNITRWIENESWILTIDSLTRSLVSEVANDAGINFISNVPDEYQIGQIKEDIIEQIRSNSKYFEDIQLLEKVFPNQEWMGDRGWIDLLDESFQNSRLYGLSASEFGNILEITFEKELYGGHVPPFDKKDVVNIFNNLRDGKLESYINKSSKNPEKHPERVEESYRYNKTIIKSFISILKEYEKLYNKRTKQNGILSHNDAKYWMVKYAKGQLNSNYRDEWLNTQKNRFRHIFVDEFQDTNYAQCELLKFFIGDNTKVFLIGDPKQAIYQWRSAEPEIFIQIINAIQKEGKSTTIPYLNASGFEHYELTSNFRSHPCLIQMYNSIFGDNKNSIFNDNLYTGNKSIPHKDLQGETELPDEDNPNNAHIHLYDNYCWNEIPDILDSIKKGEHDLWVRKNENDQPTWKKAKLGDCCILMQSRSKWPQLKKQLIGKQINYVMIAEKGLFGRAEVSLIIDILDWFANPHNKDSLVRILRSPIVGLNDRSLRFLAYHDFKIESALKDKSKPDWFDSDAKNLLDGLIKLRDDLRWLREGRKTTMIEEILKYSHLDTILLTHNEGKQYLANIWALLDIVSSWEEEELLPYNELVERLKYYRESGENAYNMAILSDEGDEDSVKIATVHATKGLEFPVVFIYYPQLNIRSQWTSGNSSKKIYIKNQGNSIAIKQTEPQNRNYYNWEQFFSTPRIQDFIEQKKEKRKNTTLSDFADIGGPSNKPKFYDHFLEEFFSEKWRLYYVALTRAKDHLLHSKISRNNNTDFKSDPYFWQYVFLKWYDKNSSNNNCVCNTVNLEPTSSSLEGDFESNNTFDYNEYKKLYNRATRFIPQVINPSHLYDLIYCPRRYQYVVLQQVSGGYTCSAEHDVKSLLFGTRVHDALELRDFGTSNDNKEYVSYLKNLKNYIGDKETDKIDFAVKQFLKSQFFKNYELDKSKVKKEMEVTFNINDGTSQNNVLMKDKIDLIVESDDGVVVADYKTIPPLDESDPGNKYLKKHYDYQLGSYVLALEDSLGVKVNDAKMLYYDYRNGKWIAKDPEINISELKNDILNNININIQEGGLEKRPKSDFCKNHCEFYNLCLPNI